MKVEIFRLIDTQREESLRKVYTWLSNRLQNKDFELFENKVVRAWQQTKRGNMRLLSELKVRLILGRVNT